MRLSHRIAVAGLFVLSAVGGGAAGADQSSVRVDVPVAQTVLPNGDTRYSVPVTVSGGAPIEASLDTGSFGLRVLSHALKSGQYQTTDIERRYAFGSGARFNGPLARAILDIGGLRTSAPVLFQLIESVDCVPQKPRCPVSRVEPKDYRIAGDGYVGLGFDAIIGLSLRKAQGGEGADNPLDTMGDGRWIVVLPRPGEAAPGHLIINPSEDDAAGFALFHLQPQTSDNSVMPGWKDADLAGCLLNEASSEKICGQTILDSGAPGFAIESTKASAPSEWPDGTPVRLEIDGGDKPVALPFKVGETTAAKIRIVPARKGANRLSVGSFPYFSYAVLYDQKNGLIGLKARD